MEQPGSFFPRPSKTFSLRYPQSVQPTCCYSKSSGLLIGLILSPIFDASPAAATWMWRLFLIMPTVLLADLPCPLTPSVVGILLSAASGACNTGPS